MEKLDSFTLLIVVSSISVFLYTIFSFTFRKAHYDKLKRMMFDSIIKDIMLDKTNKETIQSWYNQYKLYLSESFPSREIKYDNFLESIMLYARTKDKSGELTNKTYNIIIPILHNLHKNKKDNPYSDVKDDAKRILLLLEDSAKEGKFTKAKAQLNELEELFANYQQSLKRYQRLSAITIPVSIIGILMSILMALLTFLR